MRTRLQGRHPGAEQSGCLPAVQARGPGTGVGGEHCRGAISLSVGLPRNAAAGPVADGVLTQGRKSDGESGVRIGQQMVH